jgi:glycosyltransferase involved in cell wall biosynthesis
VINGKVIAVVMPAYNAARTLETTVEELPDCVDLKILVDDNSKDETVAIAARLGLQVFAHEKNYGYGRNQQTCYREALASGADIVVMVHPDYQYTPKLVAAMASMISYDVYDVVLGSRSRCSGWNCQIGERSWTRLSPKAKIGLFSAIRQEGFCRWFWCNPSRSCFWS